MITLQQRKSKLRSRIWNAQKKTSKKNCGTNSLILFLKLCCRSVSSVVSLFWRRSFVLSLAKFCPFHCFVPYGGSRFTFPSIIVFFPSLHSFDQTSASIRNFHRWFSKKRECNQFTQKKTSFSYVIDESLVSKTARNTTSSWKSQSFDIFENSWEIVLF